MLGYIKSPEVHSPKAASSKGKGQRVNTEILWYKAKNVQKTNDDVYVESRSFNYDGGGVITGAGMGSGSRRPIAAQRGEGGAAAGVTHGSR